VPLAAYPALIPQLALLASETDWANVCRAYGAGITVRFEICEASVQIQRSKNALEGLRSPGSRLSCLAES